MSYRGTVCPDKFNKSRKLSQFRDSLKLYMYKTKTVYFCFLMKYSFTSRFPHGWRLFYNSGRKVADERESPSHSSHLPLVEEN
jgi:hypothetical protein